MEEREIDQIIERIDAAKARASAASVQYNASGFARGNMYPIVGVHRWEYRGKEIEIQDVTSHRGSGYEVRIFGGLISFDSSKDLRELITWAHAQVDKRRKFSEEKKARRPHQFEVIAEDDPTGTVWVSISEERCISCGETRKKYLHPIDGWIPSQISLYCEGR